MWGKQEEQLRAVQKTSAKPLPALASKPKLSAYASTYYIAFWDLIRSAQNTMGAQQPIPLSEIAVYGRIAGFEEHELLFLYRVVKKLETVWFEHKKKSGDGKDGKGGKPGLPQAPRPPRRRSRR